MKSRNKGKKQFKDELILIFVSIMEFMLILLIFFGDSAEGWFYPFFAGIFLILIPIMRLRNSLVKGNVYRESPDCCFSILQETMDRGRATDAEILGLSYYKSEMNLKDDGKVGVRLMLRILDGEKAPYEIPVETDLPKDIVSGMKQGDTIPILIDRLDPNKIVLDFKMMSK